VDRKFVHYAKTQTFLFAIILHECIMLNIQIWRTELMKRKMLLITVGIFLATAMAGCRKGG